MTERDIRIREVLRAVVLMAEQDPDMHGHALGHCESPCVIAQAQELADELRDAPSGDETLEPGWLARQCKQLREERATWSTWMREAVETEVAHSTRTCVECTTAITPGTPRS